MAALLADGEAPAGTATEGPIIIHELKVYGMPFRLVSLRPHEEVQATDDTDVLTPDYEIRAKPG